MKLKIFTIKVVLKKKTKNNFFLNKKKYRKILSLSALDASETIFNNVRVNIGDIKESINKYYQLCRFNRLLF